MVARRAHNPEVVGSNPASATNGLLAQLVEQWIEDPCVLSSILREATIKTKRNLIGIILQR